MKAQSALEYLMVAGLIIAIVVTVFGFAIIYSSDSITTIQAQDAVNSIAKTADAAYALGKGSYLKTNVVFPTSILNSSISSNIVSITIQTSAGISTIIAKTSATINGTLPNTPGSYIISANMTDPNVTLNQVAA